MNKEILKELQELRTALSQESQRVSDIIGLILTEESKR